MLQPDNPNVPLLDGWRPRAFCIDADGILIRRPAVVDGAIEFITRLRDRQLPFRIVTNNSRQNASDLSADYKILGLPVQPENVFTAADAMAAYVRALWPANRRPRVYSLATSQLAATLRSHGCRVVRQRPEIVCLGYDPNLTFEKLARGCDAVRECGRLVAANLDPTIPSKDGEVPGVGAIAAAVAIATGVEPIAIGKPEPKLFELAVASTGYSAASALAIGDRLDTDILGAARAQMPSALVLTGSHGTADLDRHDAKPNFVFRDLFELMEWLDC